MSLRDLWPLRLGAGRLLRGEFCCSPPSFFHPYRTMHVVHQDEEFWNSKASRREKPRIVRQGVNEMSSIVRGARPFTLTCLWLGQFQGPGIREDHQRGPMLDAQDID